MRQLRRGTAVSFAAVVVAGSAALPLADSARGGSDAPPKPAGMIVYTALVAGKEQLFTLRPDGSQRSQLTKGPTRSERGAFSPRRKVDRLRSDPRR